MEVYQDPTITYGIWKRYAITMGKNGKKPLSFERFKSHVERRCVAINHGDTYLFGEMLDGVLFVSHWSPKSAREGATLLADTLGLDFQVVLNVLPGKMSKMLSRLGLHPHGEVEVDYPYPQTKIVFSNWVQVELSPEPDEYEVRAIEHGFDY